MRGYRRLVVEDLGVGAAEIWDAVTDDLPPDGQVPVATVFQTYDRSAYLRIDPALADTVPIPGPRLVLLADQRFTGPLAMRLDIDSPHGIPTDAIAAEMTCQLRGRGEDYVVAVGPTIEVAFDRSTIDRGTAADPPTVQIGSVGKDGAVWSAAARTLDWLVASEFDDGLGWQTGLQDRVADAGVPEELGRVADGWIDALAAGGEAVLPEAALAILGRGPGATPSGDDITAGICLTLAATADVRERDRITTLGDAVIHAAAERTTTVSTALLAQATRGRGADPVLEALEALLTPTPDEDRRRAVSALAEVGHSSGIDMVVGMLLTLLVILPERSG